PRIHQGQFGEAAAAAPHHARADRDAGDAVADLDHLTRAFAAARLGRGAVDAPQELAAVQRRGANSDQDLARLGLGCGRVAKFDVGSGGTGADPVGLHGHAPLHAVTVAAGADYLTPDVGRDTRSRRRSRARITREDSARARSG